MDGCATQNGVFGSIDSESVKTIEYAYEVEVTTSADALASDVLPLVEKAITDSILAELFAGCAVRRKLRRRLEVTGVTTNPEDLVVDDGTYHHGSLATLHTVITWHGIS
jgi:hypothetical protein